MSVIDELVYKLDRMPDVRYSVEHYDWSSKVRIIVGNAEIVLIKPTKQPIDMPEECDGIANIYEDGELILSDIFDWQTVTDNITDIIEIAHS